MSLTDDQIKRSEIERAWIQYQPERRRVPQEFYRKLNILKRGFEGTAANVRAALADEVSLSLIEQCCRRRGVARQRAISAVARAFSGADIDVADADLFQISWLAPSPPVIADPKHPGERQGCTLVCYLAAWAEFFGVELRSGWSMEVPDHAGARYLQWAGANADFKRALHEAANHFYATDIEVVKLHIGMDTDIYLPTREGCFICTVVGARSSGGHKFLYARASTFVPTAKLFPNQQPLRKAASAKNSVAALMLDP